MQGCIRPKVVSENDVTVDISGRLQQDLKDRIREKKMLETEGGNMDGEQNIGNSSC